MPLTFTSVSEDRPGPGLAGRFRGSWPAWHAWWASEGMTARPTWVECRQAILRFMPEIAGIYDELVELVGGSDAQARFLSFYCPPKYLAGCSQAIWQGDAPLLVRNYDYDPRAFDALTLRTGWGGRQVMGMSDGLWGLLDGMNDAGLALSLTFGGRREVGHGFGVPLILRYVLQTCETVPEACRALARVPCHMSYNVTVLDAARRFATIYLAPDRPAVVTGAPVATNHQERVEWSSHARFTATVERERFLLQRLSLHPETATRFIRAFLKPPLYSTAFAAGFGTLYTAAYEPRRGRMRLFWPGTEREFAFDAFPQGSVPVLIPERA